jgi:hypothetical protein
MRTSSHMNGCLIIVESTIHVRIENAYLLYSMNTIIIIVDMITISIHFNLNLIWCGTR